MFILVYLLVCYYYYYYYYYGAYGWGEGVFRVLLGKAEGKRPLGRPRRTWVDNIRMDLQEVGCEYMDWIGLAQDRDRWRTLVSAVMNLQVPWNMGNFLTSCKSVSFSRRTVHHGVSKYYCEYEELAPNIILRLGLLVEVYIQRGFLWLYVGQEGQDYVPVGR